MTPLSMAPFIRIGVACFFLQSSQGLFLFLLGCLDDGVGVWCAVYCLKRSISSSWCRVSSRAAALVLLSRRLIVLTRIHRRGTSMNISHEFSSLCIFLVRLHEQFASFVIQTGFRKWNDKQASDNTQDMTKCSVGSPISLQRVDTNGSIWYIHIWVINLRQEVAFWRGGWELGSDNQLELKALAFVRSASGTFNLSLIHSGKEDHDKKVRGYPGLWKYDSDMKMNIKRDFATWNVQRN